jgi:uncharacterized protein YndB with AHSA1/START domain
MGHTITLHRVITAPAERVFRAFTDAAAQAKWLAPDGFTCTVHQLEAKVGGAFRMTFTRFADGTAHSFGGTYLEFEPHRRIRYTDVFEDAALPGTMITTVEFKAVSCGTELHVTQANVPEAIPPEMCYLGWQDSLRQLASLVQAPAPPGA